MKGSVRIVSVIIAFTAPLAVAQTAPSDCPMHQAHAAAAAAPEAAASQHAHHEHAASPYAGKEGAQIKALTAEEVQEYRDGTGMGLAKPAELNHYPGPRHVLDLAADLKLTDGQAGEIKSIFDRMHEKAVSLGREILEKEKALDSEFAAGAIDETKLRNLTSQIASLQADLRATHLKAHLETRKILTAAQIVRYDELRGYARPSGS